MLHPWDMLPSSVTDEYGHAGSSTPTPHKRLPWNKGKLTGAKPPLRPKHVWSVWTTFQIEGRARDLTMFNLAIDSKLRGSNLAHERPLCAAGSTDRRNTFCELLSWGLIEQGLPRPFIELPCDRAELGLAMQGQIGATRKILAQQSVGVFV